MKKKNSEEDQDWQNCSFVVKGGFTDGVTFKQRPEEVSTGAPWSQEALPVALGK